MAKQILDVDETGTTTNCFDCGYATKKTLSQREWTCPKCGTVHHRDFSAARAIARKAQEMARGGVNRVTKPERAKYKRPALDRKA